MPDIIKPDLKSIVWLLAGMFLLPKALGAVRGRTMAKSG